MLITEIHFALKLKLTYFSLGPSYDLMPLTWNFNYVSHFTDATWPAELGWNLLSIDCRSLSGIAICLPRSFDEGTMADWMSFEGNPSLSRISQNYIEAFPRTINYSEVINGHEMEEKKLKTSIILKWSWNELSAESISSAVNLSSPLPCSWLGFNTVG